MAGLVKGKQDLTLENMKAAILVPPDLKNAYERVIAAGMKVMFHKSTHKLMLQQLQEKGPLGERMGMGIAGLVLLLFQKSNKTLPPQVLIPAGTVLLMEAVEFLRESGLEKPTNEDIAEALAVFTSKVMEKFGMDADKMIAQYDQDGYAALRQKTQAPPAGAPAPQAAPPAAAPAQPPLGA